MSDHVRKDTPNFDTFSPGIFKKLSYLFLRKSGGRCDFFNHIIHNHSAILCLYNLPLCGIRKRSCFDYSSRYILNNGILQCVIQA